MSVQFGCWNLDGRPMDPEYLNKATVMIAPYGPDGQESYIDRNIAIIYRPFHTSKESRRESQPHTTTFGAVITWDGRLDNRTELICRLSGVLTANSTDVSIVAAAYDKWGNDCFGKLIGDWALSIWNPDTRTVILAKDLIGPRHLYYSFDRDQVTWSTILDPLVLLAGKAFQLNEEYIAGWLSFFPATHLTPYTGIHSVPPSCFVLLRAGSCSVKKYWDFEPGKRIEYQTDGEYEEHFRAVFSQAVRRRLRSDGPILAELSGGMDSSSIVCMADEVIGHGEAETPRLDTLSFYEDSEPNWNERPYFTKVEEKRGRTGCHIDVSKQGLFQFEIDNNHFAITPGSGGHPSEASKQYSKCLSANGIRVVLSGIGGDEVMGGVPTPTPQLEDLLARGDFRTLAHELKVWALNKRKPWFYLLFEALRGFLPAAIIDVPRNLRPTPWLNPAFVKRNRAALTGYERRLKVFGPLPSYQDNLSALRMLQRQLACSALSSEVPCEKRYPYLDRELLEFIYAVPREQLVRAGQRRSLMRRALVGIVPDELLNRKRKAFVMRSPMVGFSTELTWLAEVSKNMISSSLGIIVPANLLEVMQKARQGQEVPVVPLLRTLGIEFWLQGLFTRGLSTLPTFTTDRTSRLKENKYDPQNSIKSEGSGEILPSH